VIGLTTGRETNQRLNSLLRDLVHVIPNAVILRRGKSSLQGLTERVRQMGISQVLVIYRSHGGPRRIDMLRLSDAGLVAVPPAMILSAVKLRREHDARDRSPVSAISREAGSPSEITRFAVKLGEALGVPAVESGSVLAHGSTFHLKREPTGTISLTVRSSPDQEVGPRLEISKLIWGNATE